MRNPVESHEIKDSDLVSRNLFCEFYPQCLDLAAEKNWPAFSCSQCRQYSAVDWSREDLEEDALRCKALLFAIFQPGQSRHLRGPRLIRKVEIVSRERQEIPLECFL